MIYFRDALVLSVGAAEEGRVALHHPDMADRLGPMVDRVPPEQLLQCIEAVLVCREALAVNVKPKFAIDALVATAGQALRPSE